MTGTAAFLQVASEADFEARARALYAHQTARNPVYAAFADGAPWRGWRAAPHLPVEAFRLADVAAFDVAEAEAVFESSGTTAQTGAPPARHVVRRLATYAAAYEAGFARAFGAGPLTLVGHLPRYAERGPRSSLVTMVEGLVRTRGDSASGLFLDDPSFLERAIAHAEASASPLVLVGAAFGLLGLCEARAWRLPAGARLVETGGMKTTRRELPREELHGRLAEGFGVPRAQVWSEYGMCELMSQAYARGGAVYEAPPWLGVRVVDPADPDRELPDGTPGRLALCDLANEDSCAFLLTEDAAVRRGPGRFEMLGRLPKASLRGCNFLVGG